VHAASIIRGCPAEANPTWTTEANETDNDTIARWRLPSLKNRILKPHNFRHDGQVDRTTFGYSPRTHRMLVHRKTNGSIDAKCSVSCRTGAQLYFVADGSGGDLTMRRSVLDGLAAQ
jgi:hypothetical protein